jgi:hypothetical protein
MLPVDTNTGRATRGVSNNHRCMTRCMGNDRGCANGGSGFDGQLDMSTIGVELGAQHWKVGFLTGILVALDGWTGGRHKTHMCRKKRGERYALSPFFYSKYYVPVLCPYWYIILRCLRKELDGRWTERGRRLSTRTSCSSVSPTLKCIISVLKGRPRL